MFDLMTVQFILVLIFLMWFAFSAFAVIYWMKTPRETLDKMFDKTKGWLWWYGYLFSILLVAVCSLSFVAVFAMVIIKGIN